MDVNFAFFGLTFAMYGLFNLVFLPMFYKTAYKLGVPIIAAICAAVLFAGAAETAALILPGAAAVLDGISPEALARQLPVLAAGMAVFVCCRGWHTALLYGVLKWTYEHRYFRASENPSISSCSAVYRRRSSGAICPKVTAFRPFARWPKSCASA